MLSITVMLLMAVSVLHHPASAQSDGSPCVTRHRDSGVCQNLSTCEYFVQVPPPDKKRVRNFLLQSVCGYVGQEIHVCCPDKIDNEDSNNNNNNDNHDNYNNNNNNNNNNNKNSNKKYNNKAKLLIPSTATRSYGPLLPPVCGTTDAKYTRIVGGVPAKLGQWPWITALGYRGLPRTPEKTRWLCGGSLISARHVLTAAHCIHRQNELFVVRLGDLDLEDDYDGATPIDVGIEKRHIHSRYNPNDHTNDIAVLRLQFDIQFTPLIRPLCLPVTDSILGKNLEGAFPFVVGWGSIYFRGPTSPRLQQIQVPIVSQSQCKRAYMHFRAATIDDRVVCAGFDTGKDACKGDSGGPLMYPIGKNFYAIGVVSYGFKCAEPGYPGIYSNVTSFLDFIIPLLT